MIYDISGHTLESMMDDERLTKLGKVVKFEDRKKKKERERIIKEIIERAEKLYW